MNEYKKKAKNPKKLDIDRARTLLLYDRVDSLKQKLRHREKMEQIALRKEQQTPFNINYIKENVYSLKFKRNPFDNKQLKEFNFKKHKSQIEMANRNMEKNRIEHVLKKVALNFVEAKSRLNLQDKDELTELKKKLILRKKTLKLTTRNTQKINSVQISITSPQPRKRRYSIIPPKHGKNYYLMKTLGNVYKDTESMRAKTAGNRSKKLKVKIYNNPICTTDVNDFIKEYDRLKVQLSREKAKFKKRKLMPTENIDEIMKTRSEMKILTLKQKYINCKFPQEKNKYKNPKDLFFEKICTEVEQSDITYF